MRKPTNCGEPEKFLRSFGLSGNQMAHCNVCKSMESNWMAVGSCSAQPPGLFFPSDGVGVEVAKKVCAECPSKEPCLEYALENRIDHGVWGGTSERQRRRILKARRTAALAH